MSDERTTGNDENGLRILKPVDIELLFPSRVINNCEDYIQKSPRENLVFEQLYCQSGLSRKDVSKVWRFTNISIQPNEASYLGLSPFCIDLHYFGGQNDYRMLYEILKLVGKPKNEETISGFKLFFDKIQIGILGADYPSGYDRNADKFKPTRQSALFEKAMQREERARVLVLFGHGGYDSRDMQKTLGTKDGSETVSLSFYLKQIDVVQYSAIVDLSCTTNPQFSLKILPGLLPENHPPFFGSLEMIDGGLGNRASDTYIIDNRRVDVFQKVVL